MGVIEAKAGRSGHKGQTARSPGGNEGRAFFRSAVNVGWQELAVPMKLFRRVGIVVYVDDDPLALGETQQGTGELAVVDARGDGHILAKLDDANADVDRVVGLPVQWGRIRSGRRCIGDAATNGPLLRDAGLCRATGE
jgi:hypothetical protein